MKWFLCFLVKKLKIPRSIKIAKRSLTFGTAYSLSLERFTYCLWQWAKARLFKEVKRPKEASPRSSSLANLIEITVVHSLTTLR
ncbi:MAG: Unknown protein [uncultured Aureispira sp.]|uniref:Uncharacterized protein n=1 Tax=uncultured Aureispira sp. TaxID=1331704 RepID=A0A6S6SWV3_9BACT|nr:MAG: Unknown protein [uncultured Aureispira sp.]